MTDGANSAEKGRRVSRRRYAIVGTGGRSGALTEPILRDYAEQAELVGLCDLSGHRVRHWQALYRDRYGVELAGYEPAGLERMLSEQRVETVIVCVPDYLHADYIVRSLEAGCDVVSEKPLTTDGRGYELIREAVERTGRRVRVAFNYRWIPIKTQVKSLMQAGIIGKIRHVAMQYALDTSHGADYFRRWHSEKDKSGGLQVHKSTHHLDLINWWTDAIPEEVYAQGELFFYGKDNAIGRGEEQYTRYDRYTGTGSEGDPFRLDLSADAGAKALYLDAEADSGYIRDRNVFRDGITIEDSFDLLIRYRGGMQATYTLQAFVPYEGMRVWFTGDKGRLEVTDLGGSHLILGQSDEELGRQQASDHGIKRIVHYPLFGNPRSIEAQVAEGSHGGGDRALFKDLYDPTAEADPYGRGAGHEQGGASLLIGAAANVSMQERRPVRIEELAVLQPEATRFAQLV